MNCHNYSFASRHHDSHPLAKNARRRSTESIGGCTARNNIFNVYIRGWSQSKDALRISTSKFPRHPDNKLAVWVTDIDLLSISLVGFSSIHFLDRKAAINVTVFAHLYCSKDSPLNHILGSCRSLHGNYSEVSSKESSTRKRSKYTRNWCK